MPDSPPLAGTAPLFAELGLWLQAAGGALFLLILAVGLFLGLAWLRPNLAVRLLLWLPAKLLYRIQVHGQEFVPTTGPALIVCNHVSWIDALLVFLAQRREIRFLMWAPFTRVPGLRVLLKLARIIPIDGSAGPRAIVQALKAASECLSQGDVVCIFAEGALTRTGFLLPFHRGFEQIVKKSPAPIIPVCLDHVWGSIFSYQGGRFLWKWPQKLPYPVIVAFGPPMPPTTRASEVRQVIQRLSADCAIARSVRRPLVHRQFLRMAARHPFRACLVDPNGDGTILGYGRVAVGAKLFADLLRPTVKNETMIGLWLPTSLGSAFGNLALAFLGKTAVNLNYTSANASVQSAIKQCGIRYVITSRLFLERMPFPEGVAAELILLEDLRPLITTWARIRDMLAVIVLPTFILERYFGIHRHQPDDLATVIFSSGSTGDPKGVMLTHRNLAANAESVIQAIDPRPSDRLLGILPFFHSFGLTVTFWLPLQVGASLLYHPDPRQAKEIGELCRRFACTIFLSTPTLLRFCLKRSEPEDFKTLRFMIVGAEKMPLRLAEEFRSRFGVQPLEGYGCTELSPVVSVNVPDYDLPDSKQIGNKPGTIGQPVPGVAVRIVDPDTFAPLSVGQEGMLLVYGANVMKGYLHRPEATRDVMRDGWYVTGDIAKYDEDGFLTITDRLARFSKIAGEMVPHQKIEDELHHLLGTADRAVVVTAVPDERRGERLCVLHLPFTDTDPGDLCRKMSERGIPALWMPDERDFLEIPELPILGTGKIDLRKARELAQQALLTART